MWMRGHRNHVHPSMYPTTDRLINHAPKEHLVDDTPGLYLHIRAGHTWKNLNAGCTTNSSTHECCAHVIEWSSAPSIPSWTRIIVNTCTEALNYHQKVHFIWWKDAYRFISTWLTWCPEPYCYLFHETTPNTVLQNRNACTYSSKVLRKSILKHWTTSRKNIIVTDVKKKSCASWSTCQIEENFQASFIALEDEPSVAGSESNKLGMPPQYFIQDLTTQNSDSLQIHWLTCYEFLTATHAFQITSAVQIKSPRTRPGRMERHHTIITWSQNGIEINIT